MNIKDNLLYNVCVKGIAGAIVGIIAGVLLGLLIFGLQSGIEYFIQSPHRMSIAPSQTATLGMAFGALIEAIMGSIAEKKEKK